MSMRSRGCRGCQSFCIVAIPHSSPNFGPVSLSWWSAITFVGTFVLLRHVIFRLVDIDAYVHHKHHEK